MGTIRAEFLWLYIAEQSNRNPAASTSSFTKQGSILALVLGHGVEFSRCLLTLEQSQALLATPVILYSVLHSICAEINRDKVGHMTVRKGKYT